MNGGYYSSGQGEKLKSCRMKIFRIFISWRKKLNLRPLDGYAGTAVNSRDRKGDTSLKPLRLSDKIPRA